MQSSEFPKSLAGFGYHFNTDGELRHIETKEPFQFVVREGDQEYNQKHYEAIGEVINKNVYSLLENRCGLKKLPVPKDGSNDEATSMVFASEDYKTAAKIIILIHGTGVVRAGQWARRLIINNSLDSGTQIPFIEKAKELGYGVVVLNTNDNKRNGIPIRESEDPVSHAAYVCKHYIEECASSKIYVIAHSYGGIVVVSLFQQFAKMFEERIVAVALTDSIHTLGKLSNFQRLLEISRNWVTSDKALDSPVERSNDIKCVSAGCTQHEWTSWYSMKSIFDYFESKSKL